MPTVIWVGRRLAIDTGCIRGSLGNVIAGSFAAVVAPDRMPYDIASLQRKKNHATPLCPESPRHAKCRRCDDRPVELRLLKESAAGSGGGRSHHHYRHAASGDFS